MDIRKIQNQLNTLGHYGLAVDGILGPKTKTAIKTFQALHNLTADGIVGFKTLAALFPAEPKTTQVTDVLTTTVLKPITASAKDFVQYAMQVARCENGVREATGKNDGYAVETFLASVGLPKGFAWCMAFIYWCYDQAALHFNKKNPLLRTGGVLYQWHNINPLFRFFNSPKAGDLFIMDFKDGHGHTGIVINYDETTRRIETIEGNTNENGSANGNGVYFRTRNAESIAGYIRIRN